MPLITNGATLHCSFGLAPSKLIALSALPAQTATIMDFRPMANIHPFALCTSPSNPTVMTATAANHGALTPQPCIPNTNATWTPGAPIDIVNGQPALDMTSTCQCAWGGKITILTPSE